MPKGVYKHKKGQKRPMAKRIVQDHIGEMGCEYYPSLIRMEKQLTKSKRRKKNGKKS